MLIEISISIHYGVDNNVKVQNQLMTIWVHTAHS